MFRGIYAKPKNVANLKALTVAVAFSFLFIFTPIAHAAGPTVSIDANGSTNSLAINQGEVFSVSWNASSDATSCTTSFNGQALSGTSVSGSFDLIDASNSYYPTQSQPSTFSVSCTDGTDTNSASVTVSLNAPALVAPTLNAVTSAQCGGQIDLSWNSISGATSYFVTRDNVQIGTTAGTTFSDTGLTVDSSYTYTVQATDGTNTSIASNSSAVFASSACASGGSGGSGSGTTTTTVFNSDPADFQTVRVSNFSLNPFSTATWAPSINANPGDIVTVGIYYHNSGTVDALNTTIGISAPVGVSQSNFTVSGGVSADNASSVGGSATITISSNQTLTYVPNSAKLYPNQTQDPAQAVTLSDYTSNNIGTIAPGFPSQGMLIAQFQVSNTSATSTPLATPVISAVPISQCGGYAGISWASVLGATSYKVFRDGVQVGTTANLSYTDSGLNFGPTYTYFVIATDGTNDSLASNSVGIMATQVCSSGGGGGGGPVTPSAPTNVIATTSAQCGGQITLTWSPVSNALSYKIFRDGTQVGTVASTSSTITDSDLVPGSTHSYYVVASNTQGDSPQSSTSTATSSSACSGPAGPLLVGVTGSTCGGEIVLSWSQIPGSSSFKIFRAISGGAFTQVGTTTNLSFTDSGLVPSTTYQYFVIAVVGGVDSPPSNTLSLVSSAQCTAVPSAPVLSGLTGASCGGQIDLSWTASTGAISYNVYRGGTVIASTTNLSFTDTVAPNTTFSYTIRAINTVGQSADSNTVSITSSNACGGGGGGTAPILSLIANPNIISTGATTTLTWTSTNTTSCSAVGGWTLATTTSGSQILSPATTTTYVINCSGPSGTGSATTTVTVLSPTSLPAVPTNLTANTSAQCGGQIDLSWTASLNATFYNVLRNGSFVASTTNTTFTDTGLTFGQSYSYTVQAGNQLGTSTNSNTATASASSQCSSGGGGGGGGGGSSSGGGGSSGGAFMPVYTGGAPLGYQCSYLKDYLRIDFQNNPIEVMKLQIFLREIEGESGVQVTGTFDQVTFDATSRFQIKYQGDVLTPWGYAQGESTGYVYILTQKKINEIVCNQILTLSQGQLSEISNFNSFLASLGAHGISSPANANNGDVNNGGTQATSTATSTGIISEIINNPNVKNAAAALFAGPQGFRNTLKATFVFLLVLLAAYVLAEEAIRRFLKTSDKDSERLRRLAIVIGFLCGAIAVSAILRYFVIIVPLIVLIMLMVIFSSWVILKKRKTDSENKMRGFANIPPNVIIIPPTSS
ncbi:MAG: hypothetical protein WA051_02110 [Minisyncoccia bacterium]